MVKELNSTISDIIISNPYLDTEEKCILCKTDIVNGKIPEQEHIFPGCAIKQHELLSGYEDLGFNIVSVCTKHHDIIDDGNIKGRKGDGKIAIYKRGGMVKLVEFIAAYPRTPILELKNAQHEQWIDLFEETKVRLERANGNTPQDLLDTYKSTAEVIESFLVFWRDKGDFVKYIPVPERVISIP